MKAFHSLLKEKISPVVKEKATKASISSEDAERLATGALKRKPEDPLPHQPAQKKIKVCCISPKEIAPVPD